jgi:voltage-gated sodium channel
VVVKLLTMRQEPLKYFVDPWNKFDFFIVAVCWIFNVPALQSQRSLVSMLRLLRLLRVLKLVNALPQLRIIIEALISGFSSITFVVIILFVFFYIYANIGMIFFAQNDPTHFGNLQMALITMFRLSTLDGWSDILYVLKNIEGPPPSFLYI